MARKKSIPTVEELVEVFLTQIQGLRVLIGDVQLVDILMNVIEDIEGEPPKELH